MEIKGMKEEFFDWLNECPVQWNLIKDDESGLEYSFNKEEEEYN
jgi:hypothetical protein